ncbi:imidazole glycerol phosphate synthase subunit HisH [Candidatus Pelagibacter sp. Uisw_099_02]|uniref:imidazole glycerol phosphate synthase subunit HisH n=1 Tax=Candidatus Pelagibacter sp. Uisw_099_02 TaxID=3230981 RepID=UPI0039ED8937|tara:strand:- start:32 stop:643 length:612 start_codon:yes stop_codon:yes gene_type:complete
MLGVINYGSGNFRSVINILNFLKINFREIKSEKALKDFSHIILPGVGSYRSLHQRLIELNLVNELKYQVLDKKKFFLGICVGMQILSSYGNEGKESEGLNIIEGLVEKIPVKKSQLPNIGWHKVELVNKESKLFQNISEDERFFYFVHSYYFNLKDKGLCSSKITYDIEVTSSIEKDNIYGVQFHPEKSQSAGCKLLQNFYKL